MDLTKSFLDFFFAGVVDAGVKSGENLRAGGKFGADDEGEVEFGEVASIEVGELLVFFFAESVEAEAGLFGGGFGSEFAGAGELATEIGMGADEGELGLVGGGFDGGFHAGDEVVASGEGEVREGLFGHPGGVLVNRAEQVDELGLGHLIEI